MQVSVDVQGMEETIEMLDRAEHLLRGDRRALEPAWRAIGIEALKLVQQNIASGGKRVGGWKKLSPVTVLLRRRGQGEKIVDKAGLARKGSHVKILQDTGLMLASLHSQRQGNIFDTQSLSVRVGTADKKAFKHHYGGKSTFHFNQKMQRRFDQNVRKTLPGSKPRVTKTGRQSRAKRNWNRFYFVWRRRLINMDGKSYKIPARPIFFDFRDTEKNRFVQMLGRHIDRKMEELSR